MERPDEDTAWCFRVVRENGAEVVGLARKIAIPYCMTVATALVREAGGWDTTFCDGLCYEDNDFAARLLLAGVVYRWCDQFRNVHLSHKRYGGRERRDRIRANEQIWRDRIGGRPGSLWPLQGNGSPPDGVVGDGTGYQVSLRETLTGWGYPAKGKA
jgi:GT2 family glycosyltransferase